MFSKNNVNLEGRVSRFDLVITKTNRKIAKLVLTVYQSNGKGRQPDFVDYRVTHWNPDENTIDTLNKLVQTKGNLEILGFLKQEKYKTKEGQERFAFGIVALKLVFGKTSEKEEVSVAVASEEPEEETPF